ncbi:MAG TPA: XisH family protein [Caldilineaceae bacterium]|nr:XisH family protein [Caldilineaceae bacterium]
MPQRDTTHHIVRQALIRDGWEITDDPFVISFGERFLFLDLGASIAEGHLIGAQRSNRRIAVEVKEFRNRSPIADLEHTIGQYVLYKLLLREVDPERTLYLAITDQVYSGIFQEPIGELVISTLPLQLLIVDTEVEEVRQWIPELTIARS